MNTIFRAAKPEDAAFLGWACVMSARSHMPRGWFDVLLGRDDKFVLEFAKHVTLAKARSWWHWSLFQVAEVDGVVASAMCGFGDDSVYVASSAALEEAATKMGISATEQAQFWDRGSFILAVLSSEPEAWTVENVATKPQYRGTGVSQALVEKELDVARAAGFKRAQVSYFIGNKRGERLYTKSGFRFAEEKRDAPFETIMGSPGTIRLVRNL